MEEEEEQEGRVMALKAERKRRFAWINVIDEPSE